jgi:hypothetical protein
MGSRAINRVKRTYFATINLVVDVPGMSSTVRPRTVRNLAPGCEDKFI